MVVTRHKLTSISWIHWLLINGLDYLAEVGFFGTDSVKVTADQLERCPLSFDFLARAHSQAPKRGHWGTPSLNGVLQKKPTDNRREEQPFAADDRSQDHPAKTKRSRIGLQQTFHVPFPVEFLNSPCNLLRAGL